MPNNSIEQTDVELVRLSLLDNRNFGTLIERYEKKFLAYIRRISGANPDDAQDILQDAFIKIYQNLSDFESDLKFSSWSYRIVRNQTFDYLRKKKSRPQIFIGDEENNYIEQIADQVDFTKILDQRILHTKIRAGLQKLEPKYQEILELHFLEEKSYEEITDILHCPIGTVGTLISRAKKKLKAILNSYDELKWQNYK